MSDITVYGASLSPFVRKVLVAAAEKGLPCQNVSMGSRDIPAELRPHTPLGKIPFANIGGKWLADSTVICSYIESRWPTPALYPADAYERARALWFEEYIDGGAIPKVGPKTVVQRLIRPLLLGQPCDEAQVQEAIEKDLPPMWSYLDGQLAGRTWLVGESMSIGDIAVASFEVSLMHAGIEAEASKYPNVVRHRDALWARPSFAKLIAEEKSSIEKLKAAKGQPVGT